MKSGSRKKSTASKSVIATLPRSARDAVGLGELQQRGAVGREHEAGLDRLVGVGGELLLVLLARRVELLQLRVGERLRRAEQQADRRRHRAGLARQRSDRHVYRRGADAAERDAV